MTVRTSRTAFLPCSFDSPLARSRMSTGTSAHPQAGARASRMSASTSGAPARVRLGEQRQRLRVAAYMPLVASPNGRPSAKRHRRGAGAPCRAARAASGGSGTRRSPRRTTKREPTATSHVAGAHELEQALQLGDRVLPVGVDAAAAARTVLARPALAGGDRGLQPAVLAEREDVRAVLARDARRCRSVEPSSTTRTSASGSSVASSSRTAGRFASSFQAGMKTRVSEAWVGMACS